MNEVPILSIGLPLYNAGAHLRPALESLLAQDIQEFELLISDNASQDETEATCRDWASRDARVHYERLSHNMGQGANFLRVLQRARAPFFMWAAHDDRWEPRYASRLIEELRRNDAVLGFAQFDMIDHASGRRSDLPRFQVSSDGGPYRRAASYLANPVSNVIYGVFRRDVLCAAMASVRELFDYWDVYVVTAAALRGRIVIVPDVLFHTGITPGHAHRRSLSKKSADRFRFSYWELYSRLANEFLHAPGLRRIERLSLEALLLRQVLGMIKSNELSRAYPARASSAAAPSDN